MRKIINIILSLVVIISFAKIAYKTYQYYVDKKEYANIQEFSPRITQNIENNEVNIGISDNHELNNDYEISNKEEDLFNINSEYKFWINISNSNIDYPVVQGIDNDFYLSHNFNKEKNISGSLFIDYQNNIDDDKNIVIYWHNMKNNTMFNNLNFFKEKDFFNNNIITITRNGRVYKYNVFSVYVIPEEEVSFNMGFSDENDYLRYMDELSSKSYFKKDIEFDSSKDMITLVTCSYEYDGARTIVHAISS